MVIEVPSMDDPLISLYRSEPYRRFYFQRQHPYVYTLHSLARLLEHTPLEVERKIPHQRYGLENHLQWLADGTPGGNETYREIFGDREDEYMRALERFGRTDAVIFIAGRVD